MGAPRIHGELLKLGVQVPQATVAKYMMRSVSRPHKRGALFLRTRRTVGFIRFLGGVDCKLSFIVCVRSDGPQSAGAQFTSVTAHPTADWTAWQIGAAFPGTMDRVICCIGIALTEQHSLSELMKWEFAKC